MRIGLISDTHIPWSADVIPPKVKEVFKGVDLILHGGDIYQLSVLDELEEIAPVLAAQGDDDCSTDDSRVKETHILAFEGFNLWLTHTIPYPSAYPFFYPGWEPIVSCRGGVERTLKEAILDADNVPDILVFGDTHHVFHRSVDGVLFVNPGSATLPRYKRSLGTVALLSILQGKAEVDIIQL